jgi:hypothetical protein
MHRVVDRQVLEVFLLAECLIQLQQEQPVHRAAVGGAVEVLQQCNQPVDPADLQLELGLARGAQDLDAFIGALFVDHGDAREVDPHDGIFWSGGDALAKRGRRGLVKQAGHFQAGGLGLLGFAGVAACRDFANTGGEVSKRIA